MSSIPSPNCGPTCAPGWSAPRRFAQGSQARDRLLEQLLDTVDFPLPDSAIQAEVDYREHEIVHALGHDDAAFDEFLERQGQTREEFTGQLRESARKSVKAQFLLDAIADADQVDVGEAELTEYLVRQAARYNMAPQEFANQLVEAGNLPALMADVRRNKALATVLQEAEDHGRVRPRRGPFGARPRANWPSRKTRPSPRTSELLA